MMNYGCMMFAIRCSVCGVRCAADLGCHEERKGITKVHVTLHLACRSRKSAKACRSIPLKGGPQCAVRASSSFVL